MPESRPTPRRDATRILPRPRLRRRPRSPLVPSHATLTLAALILTLACLAAFLAYVVYPLQPDHRPDLRREADVPARSACAPSTGARTSVSPRPTAWSWSGPTSTPRTEARAGVIVFCHEYLSDRWSFQPYADHLRDQGFDLFTFDFRNHGQSACDPGYQPLQWVTDHEVSDLRAALAYLRSRPDHDPAGFGLFGVSRGGGTALLVAADDPDVWGVVTDGAFPTRGTMLAYILRWAEIFVGNRYLWKYMPAERLLLPRLGRPAALGAAAQLPVPRRRACGRPADPPALAHDPRREGCLHRPRDRHAPLRPRRASPRSRGSSPGPSTTAAARSSPRRTRARIASFFRGNAPRRPLRATSSAPSVVSPPVEETPAVAARKAVRIPLVTLDGGLVAPVHGRT